MGGTVTPGTISSPLANLDSATTTFHFTADAVGKYAVNYTVTDQDGGYASGVVNINVGKLTSPNSPLANTPGRMVEWVTVSDGLGNDLVVHRPVLFDEFQAVCDGTVCQAAGSGDKASRNETWVMTEAPKSTDFCRQYGMALISPAAFTVLRNDYTGEGKTLTTELGWPSQGSSSQKLYYLVQDMDGAGVPSNQTIDAETGASADATKGMVICAKAPTAITYTPSGNIGANLGATQDAPLEMNPAGGNITIALGNINGTNGSAMNCAAKGTDGTSASTVITATCSNISDPNGDGIGEATLTLAPGSTLGQALITASVQGNDSSFKKQPALNIYVARDAGVTTGGPTLTNYKIEAQVNKTLGATAKEWVTVVDQNGVNTANQLLVRPGTALRASWTFDDPDSWQTDASTVAWGSNITADSSDNKLATVAANYFGPVTVTLTPANKLASSTETSETGTAIPLSFTVTNNPPVISNLTIASGNVRDGAAFNQTSIISATDSSYQYSDPNNDAQQSSGTTYVWEQKRPWTENWEPVKNSSSTAQTGQALDSAIINEFFNSGGRYEGNDLRLRMKVQDDQGTDSAESIQMVYPATETPATTVTIRALTDPSPLLLHRASDFTTAFDASNINAYDDSCRAAVPTPGSTYTQVRLLRPPTINSLQDQKKTLGYWNPLFVSHPKMPFATGQSGNQAVGLWSAATGAVLTQPLANTTFTDASLVCEEVPLDDLQIIPATANVMLSQTLQLSLIGYDVKDQLSIVDSAPTDASQASITWSSNSPDIATIDANGLVTPVAAGTAEITAAIAGTAFTRQVTVTATATELPLCYDTIDPNSNNMAAYGNYKDCVVVRTMATEGALMTGSPATTILHRLGFSYDPKGLVAGRTYQAIFNDNLGWSDLQNVPLRLEVGAFLRNNTINARPHYCNALNDMAFQGRTNWSLASLEQLQALFDMQTLWYNTAFPVRGAAYATGDVDKSFKFDYTYNQAVTGSTLGKTLYVACYSAQAQTAAATGAATESQ